MGFTSSNSGAAIMPSGAITSYGGSAAPPGWLLCDGTPYSRTTFSSLFAAIGTAYGTGDGSTTFNVPNLTRSFCLGPGGTNSSGQIGTTLGSKGGEEVHVLSVAELAQHDHLPPAGFSGYAANLAGNGVGIVAGNAAANGVGFQGATDFTGSSNGHNNMPPAVVVQFIIKT